MKAIQVLLEKATAPCFKEPMGTVYGPDEELVFVTRF